MPGLSGKVTRTDTPVDRPDELIDAFRRVHALRGVDFIESSLATPHAAILHLQTGLLTRSLVQPAWAPNRTACLFLEGEVFNLDELRPRAKVLLGPSPCETLLSLFLENGTAIAPLLDGQFNIALYEAQASRLTIINDRLSSKPLYYAEEDGGLLFGSEKKSILAVARRSPRIDPVGLVQIFAHRHNLAGRTFLEGLRRLAPSSELTFHNGVLATRQYETLRFEAASPLPPVRTLVEEWGEALKTDMRRRVRGKERVLISLSGGLDSRAFTCAIPRDFRPLAARTRGSHDSLDVVYAKAIAERLGIEHFQEDPADVPYSEFIAKAVWRTECEVTFSHCFSIAAHDRIKQHGDFIFAGQSGEIVAGGHIYPYMFVPRSRASFIERAYNWYMLYSERKLRQVFNPDFLARALPGVREAFLASFAPYDGDSNVDAYQAWDLLERQARMTLSAGPVDSHRFEKVYALIGRTYTDYALRLPVSLRYGQTLYQCMIRHLGPEIADIPYANTNLRLRRSIWGNLLNKGAHLTRKGWQKLVRKLRLSPNGSVAGAGETYGRSVRDDAGFHRLVAGFVASNDFDSDVFSRAGIEALLAAEYGGGPSQHSLLCLLATFAVGLPYFAYRRTTSCPGEAEPMG